MTAKLPSLVTRKRIQVAGVVQGVGFRPFVYNLAQDLGLAGYALNSSAGVTIELEGDQAEIQAFLHTLEHQPPSLARIERIVVSEIEPNGELQFSIRKSLSVEGEFSLIPADVGTCEDCWRDFTDPNNRRFGYPFTNCTNCGPRYTIVQDVPYDRPATTMSSFRMCPECQAEYEDPRNRRFHAQPNACPVCGPQLVLAKSGAATERISDLRVVRNLLREGLIVAVKGLGGFLLACDATNEGAVRELRKRKRRSEKPFALMARDLTEAEKFCIVSEGDRKALTSSRRPIVIMSRKAGSGIAPEVAPGNNTLGVMLPYTPLHYLLFGGSSDEQAEFSALVMTSGNFSEEPIVISNEEAAEHLQPIADWFLFHDRDIYVGHKIAVQHHHAHIASCMAENQLSGKVIGVAFDGTGYGTDGQVWGGEFLVADLAGFERHAHLRYVSMAGGDAAVRQPWRMALSYLLDTFPAEHWPVVPSFAEHVSSEQISTVQAMLKRGINTVQTSSCGRLFDAVASLIGIQHDVTFEGQAAIALENAASANVAGRYPFAIEEGHPARIDLRPMIAAIIEDLSRSRAAGDIAAVFHNTLAQIIVDVVLRIRDREGLTRVCLSGGTFQNHWLLERAVRGLRENGLEVFLHISVPPNDGGISLGQAAIANELLKREN